MAEPRRATSGNEIMPARPWPAMAVLLAVLVLATTGTAMAKVDEPAYRTLSVHGDMELRRYEPMLVAEVTRSGSRRAAANAGFRALADYIFGANVPSEKIEMTAPVTQAPARGGRRSGEKIEMTAPVSQLPAAGGAWRIRFVMPEGYTKASLPKPENPEIRIIEEAATTYAVVRFSGIPGGDKLARKTEELRAFMAARGLPEEGDPVYAFYDPPWTLPFLRRNEVMIETTR